MHKESQQEINWQREVIEKIINDKYGPSNQKNGRSGFGYAFC